MRQLRGPGAHQVLKEEILVVTCRGRGALDVSATRAQDSVPGVHLRRPFIGNKRKRSQAGTGVFAAFDVVGGSAEHAARPVLGAMLVFFMKSVHAQTELIGRTSHIVQGNEAVVAVKSR